MKHIWPFILLILLLSSCEEKIEWDLKTKQLPVLIVEGGITNQKKAHAVKLTLPVTDPGQVADPASGATVAITFSDSVILLREDPLSPGIYKTDTNIRGVTGKIYGLYIRYQGHEFQAFDYMPPVGELEPLKYHEVNGTSGFFELNEKQSSDPSLTKIYLDWSWMVPPENKPEARALQYFYTLNSIDVNEFFKPDRSRVVFPSGTVIIREKYSLSSQYQEFIRSMLMETEWKGGIFDVLPANVNSNIRGGGLGYFYASTVITDTSIFIPPR